jgi:cytochrome c-type biogenesis protein CcmH/NrfG
MLSKPIQHEETTSITNGNCSKIQQQQEQQPRQQRSSSWKRRVHHLLFLLLTCVYIYIAIGLYQTFQTETALTVTATFPDLDSRFHGREKKQQQQPSPSIRVVEYCHGDVTTTNCK